LPAPADGPRVVVASIKSAQRIVALNDDAARLGLKLDMPLADARAMYPALPVADADAQADRRLLEAVADWCDRYTPLVGLDPPDGLVLDIAGCAHLFGGEATLVRDLLARLAHQGFQAHAAIADTVGCAFAVARYGDFQRPVHVPSSLVGTRDAGAEYPEAFFIVPRGRAETAVLPLPVAALRVDAETAGALAAMGLKRVADLAARPRAPLAARFGENLLLRLDRALGRADEPISPRLPLPQAMAEQRFAEPIALEGSVLGSIEYLARQLAELLERRGEGARLIAVALFRTDGVVHRLEIGTGVPLRDPARVRRLFEDRLAALGEACDPGFGYDMVRLSALLTERCEPVQAGLHRDGASGVPPAEELAHLIDRLGARFGLRRITRLVPQDTHIPEFAVAAVPAHAARPERSATRSAAQWCVADPGPRFENRQPESRISGAPLARCTASETREESLAQESLSPTRPIRLFERPEPIEAIAEVPDGPPVRFRWRQVLHQVAQAEGPERIAMQWWRDASGRALTRDYFRVESVSGARVWLYREGLYGRETERPRWFLHGLFA
jgi:protein ImuB